MVNYYYELVIKPSEYYNLFLDFLLDIYPDGFEELDGSLILRSENSLDEIIWAVKYFTQELEKKLKKTKIISKTTTVYFKNLKSGTYAISVYKT